MRKIKLLLLLTALLAFTLTALQAKEAKPVTAEELIKEVGEYHFQMLTNVNIETANRCIEKAATYIKAKFAFCGYDINKIDFENQLVKEALSKRACYELYSYGEQEEKAKDKKEDALELLAGILGSAVFKSDYPVQNNNTDNSNYTPCISVKKGADNWSGFS